jgi:hypothetical protein
MIVRVHFYSGEERLPSSELCTEEFEAPGVNRTQDVHGGMRWYWIVVVTFVMTEVNQLGA